MKLKNISAKTLFHDTLSNRIKDHFTTSFGIHQVASFEDLKVVGNSRLRQAFKFVAEAIDAAFGDTAQKFQNLLSCRIAQSLEYFEVSVVHIHALTYLHRSIG